MGVHFSSKDDDSKPLVEVRSQPPLPPPHRHSAPKEHPAKDNQSNDNDSNNPIDLLLHHTPAAVHEIANDIPESAPRKTDLNTLIHGFLRIHSFAFVCQKQSQHTSLSHSVSEYILPTAIIPLIVRFADEQHNIRVFCHFRPVTATEMREQKRQNIMDAPPAFVSIDTVELPRLESHRAPFLFRCEHIFRANATQTDVFHKIGKPMAIATLDGFNTSLVCYGQTGGGKSFALFGDRKHTDIGDTDTDTCGLVTRYFKFLFQKLEEKKSEGNIALFGVTLQFLWIRKTQLADLMRTYDSKDNAEKLVIETDAHRNAFVKNLSKVNVSSVREVVKAMGTAHRNCTHRFGHGASRTTSLVLAQAEQRKADGSRIVARVVFVDCAGSEDIRKALGPNPDRGRMMEAIALMSSITALTTAICHLAKGRHPSYRSSHLTSLLANALGGNSKTFWLGVASPHIHNRRETMRTVRCSKMVAGIRNAPTANVTLSDSAIRQRMKEMEAEMRNVKVKVEEFVAMRNANGERCARVYLAFIELSVNGLLQMLSDRIDQRAKY